MVTGDAPLTAFHVAKQVALADEGQPGLLLTDKVPICICDNDCIYHFSCWVIFLVSSMSSSLTHSPLLPPARMGRGHTRRKRRKKIPFFGN